MPAGGNDSVKFQANVANQTSKSQLWLILSNEINFFIYLTLEPSYASSNLYTFFGTPCRIQELDLQHDDDEIFLTMQLMHPICLKIDRQRYDQRYDSSFTYIHKRYLSREALAI